MIPPRISPARSVTAIELDCSSVQSFARTAEGDGIRVPRQARDRVLPSRTRFGRVDAVGHDAVGMYGSVSGMKVLGGDGLERGRAQPTTGMA